MTTKLLYGQVEILKHVSQKLKEATDNTKFTGIRVEQFVNNEFQVLIHHVAFLEAKCVTEDFQTIQARVDGTPNRCAAELSGGTRWKCSAQTWGILPRR